MADKKRMFSQMFDIRPVTQRGGLDVKKIQQITAVLDLRNKKTEQEIIERAQAIKARKEIRKPVVIIKKVVKKTAKKPLIKQIPKIELAIKQIEKAVIPEKITKELASKKKKLIKKTEIIKKAPKSYFDSYPEPPLIVIPQQQSPYLDLSQELNLDKESLLEEIAQEKQPIPVEKDLPDREEILSELIRLESEEVERAKKAVPLKKKKIVKKRKYDFDPLIISKPKTLASSDIALDLDIPQQFGADIDFDVEKELSALDIDKTLGTKKSQKPSISFFLVSIIISLIVPSLAWIGQGIDIKGRVLGSSMAAYQNLLSAGESLENTDWQSAQEDFSLAYSNFLSANDEIKSLGQVTVGILEHLPGGSLVASGEHLVKVGQSLSDAGKNLSAVAAVFTSFDFNNLLAGINEQASTQYFLTDLFASGQQNLAQAKEAIIIANQELSQVEVDALPSEYREQTAVLKEKLPMIEQVINRTVDYSNALMEILGHQNQRQYLLLFQNNSEMRATGGFIGTYGLLGLDRGSVKKLFIEGVYNVDGQLKEKIIPPRPLQKVSTAWSMHDANWFADFPTSAQKVAWFYEKTGGPTVDGAISFTPIVFERLLELTGPIAMPEYDITLNAQNFIELMQYKVEVDYDKALNQPKRILADFAPKFVKALRELPLEKQTQALEIFFKSLREKHILLYFKNSNLENFISNQGWAGQIIDSEKDYLSVVSSNINGFKSDKMVQESIKHEAQIQSDGSIIDTVIVTRQHTGGKEEYDWWNKVNANYIRVYLPEGSELISARGQTLEPYIAPIDYEAHGFSPDPLVKKIEDRMFIDKKSGTRIFEESGKTVFGNWVYVSPGRTVKLTYKYKLPFKIDLTKSADSYSLLVQKQSGSLGSAFKTGLDYPSDWQTVYQYPVNWGQSTLLETDKFYGVTFEGK